jgi:uncharacterized protein (DUF1800 family)
VTEPASLLEEIRFGYGPRAGWPLAPGGVEPDRVMAQLSAPDPDAALWNTMAMADRFAVLIEAKRRKVEGATGPPLPDMRALARRDEIAFVTRPASARLGFVERLVNLWANRLTVAITPGSLVWIASFRDDAIRPRIGGRFADLLKASLWHPAMLIYLTQHSSVGPNSELGLRRGRGLNENLAREFLELHSMGAGYDQADVTELARLLAGMAQDETGRRMARRAVEPGVKTILGETYGEGIHEIDRLVESVAARPETAQSVAVMLARHFVRDDPPADLVDDLAQTYLRQDGNLQPVYRALLAHPAARQPVLAKLRSPQEYMAASLRAVGLTGDPEENKSFQRRGTRLGEVMARMGQPIFRTRQSDGWPETAPGWLTPPMLASRLDWAADLAQLTGDRADPVAQARAVLGELASPLLLGAVAGAEQRWEGLAVLLGSPEFMRR